MAHTLKQLLGNDHPLFVASIADLEKATGDAGVDTRLLADILEKGHKVLRRLGLDPANTTASEAYFALRNFVKTEAAWQQLRDTDYVILVFEDGRVSFNLQDAIENFHHELEFKDRKLDHAVRHLRAEVVRRYAENERTHEPHVHTVADAIGLKPERDKGHQDVHHPVSNAPRVLAIGDIFTDAFIKLNEEVARVDVDADGSKRISLPLGSKPPYDGVDIVRAVGPSPNAAVSMARLGLDVSLLAFLGDDQPGHEAKEQLQNEGIDTDLLSTQPGIPSNYYYVLRYGAERTILVKNENYRYEWVEPKKEPDWIYLSLISDQSWKLHEDLLKYLREHDGVKLAFQPGTFHFKWGAEKLKEVYGRSYIVVLNREEAMDITGKPHEPLHDLANAMHDLGPQIVVITDGPDGSYASYDGKLVTIPNYPDPAPPLDRTGAGDAFASTIVAALAVGETMDTALAWAPINSMSVVQQLGAQAGLLGKDRIKEYLASAPDDYKVMEVSE